MGTCRNCAVDEVGSFSLFNDAFRRPLKMQKGFSSRILLDESENGDVCTCPNGLGPGPNQGPSVSEFQEVFNERLLLLIQEGWLPSFTHNSNPLKFENLKEGQLVGCGSGLRQFTTTIITDWVLQDVSLPASDKALLESTFKDTYNRLAYSTCDAKFRRVVKIELGSSNAAFVYFPASRRLGDSLFTVNLTMNSTLWNATSNASYTPTPAPSFRPSSAAAFPTNGNVVFSVVGECRNCAVNEAGSFALFDDTMRRTLETITWDFRNLAFDANSSNSDICFCPVGTSPADGRSPNIPSFLTEFNDKILQLQISGALRTPLQPNMTFFEPTPKPTSAPTFESTSKPTPVPTFKPTPEPTPVPTFELTPLPSQQPIVIPPSSLTSRQCQGRWVETDDSYYVLLSGGQTTASDVELNQAFIDADSFVHKPLCSPVLTNVIIADRYVFSTRRRLQDREEEISGVI